MKSELLSVIEDIACLGGTVTFRTENRGLMVGIVYKSDKVNEQRLPLDNHITDKRVADCLNFQLQKIFNER